MRKSSSQIILVAVLILAPSLFISLSCGGTSAPATPFGPGTSSSVPGSVTPDANAALTSSGTVTVTPSVTVTVSGTVSATATGTLTTTDTATGTITIILTDSDTSSDTPSGTITVVTTTPVSTQSLTPRASSTRTYKQKKKVTLTPTVIRMITATITATPSI